MITIVEPRDHIARLWSKPEVKTGDFFRLMRYVLWVDHEDQVLLHNVVTGQLVLLDQGESEVVKKLPVKYSTVIQQLVDGHFLVAENFDEHQYVTAIRMVLRRLDDSQRLNNIIDYYTILPTTACNARCYYCFEHNIKPVTMSEQTADDVVKFISSHCGKNRTVSIAWFGGEPTLTTNRIEQICVGLQKNNVVFSSRITTNGYLFDEDMVERAKALWNLKSVNISMDGVEEKYNSIKAYTSPNDNPYQRVMRNIGLLLEKGIHVNLRMNFDISNYTDFEPMLREIIERFRNSPDLSFSVHQINSVAGQIEDLNSHGSDEWFSEKILEMNNLIRKSGLYQGSPSLPALISVGCKACMESTVTITPEGNLVRCPEQLSEDQITGNVKEGITNQQLVQNWKQLGNIQMCNDCQMFPHCLKVQKCFSVEKCYYKLEYSSLYREAILQSYFAYQSTNQDEGGV